MVGLVEVVVRGKKAHCTVSGRPAFGGRNNPLSAETGSSRTVSAADFWIPGDPREKNKKTDIHHPTYNTNILIDTEPDDENILYSKNVKLSIVFKPRVIKKGLYKPLYLCGKVGLIKL